MGIPMERSSNRRLNPTKEHRHRYAGRLSERVSGQAAVDAIRLEINQQTPQQLIKSITLETLVNHYRQHELPDVFNKRKPQPGSRDEETKSYATQVTYQ